MIRADSTGMASAVSRPMLFDTRRGLYYPKPALRGWLHLLWFEASLVIGTLLLAHAHGARQIIAVAIFAASVTGLFGISALYHRGNWGPLASRWLQRLDHVMIFLLIAGTGTAAFLLTAPKLYAAVGLSVLCGLTLAAIVTHLVWMNAPEKLVGAIFIGLGWTAGLAAPAVWVHAGIGPVLLLLAGGVLYTVGAVTYYRRSPDPVPAVFGFHEVFHAYVCAAAACQYVGISLLIH
jgi:hemolysin III